jgi:hypothetical protein
MTGPQREALEAALAQLDAGPGHGWAAEAILRANAGAPGATALVLLGKRRAGEAAAEIRAKLLAEVAPAHA